MKAKLKRLAALANRQDVKTGLVVGLMTLAGSAHAAIDVTETVALIVSVLVAITSIGMASLSVVVTVKMFSWVRGALK